MQSSAERLKKRRERQKKYMRKIRKERERWRKENPEKYMEYQKKDRAYKREWASKKAKEKNPNAKTGTRWSGFYYDFETHREFAMNSGIQNVREWYECHRRGFFPDGIYSQPNQAFRK